MSTFSIWMIAWGLVIGLISVLGATLEYWAWNHGVCRTNGLPWERFDTSSQGCRGYRAGDEYTWITYPWIDRRNHED